MSSSSTTGRQHRPHPGADGAGGAAVRQAEAKLLQAPRDLAQAELNLRYCDIVSEIDGVVTSRNVNPATTSPRGRA